MKQIKGIELLVGEVAFMHVFLNIPVKPKVRLNKLVITCKEQRTTGRYVLVQAERGSAFFAAGSNGPIMVSMPG